MARNTFRLGKGTKIGLLPDRHSFPGCDMKPTIATARWFAEQEVDIIVDIGDRFDMPSLSSYDRGKASFEGRRLSRDLSAARVELERFDKELGDWEGILVHTQGNHENRLTRLYDDQPEMMDMIGDDPWGLEEYGYHTYKYLEIVKINEIRFSHAFQNPTSLMGAIQGGSADIRMKNIGFPHVQGHQHGPLIHQQIMRGDGSPVSTLVMGACYSEHHSYNGPQRKDVWRGAAILENAYKGKYDLQYKRLDNLIAEFC